MTFYSPLRYPGGKNRLAKFMALLCEKNEITRTDGHYIEPYAGGASVALHLLLEGYVKEITINDKDRAIYAFWHSILNNSEEFISLIRNTRINIDNWRRMRGVLKNKDTEKDLLKLGFATFFLNRTNVSGILNGGPIGNIKQTGKYKLACRFNKTELIKRIQKIAACRHNIHICNLDALSLVDEITNIASASTIFYFDPPYYLKGESLYLNAYGYDDHKQVSKKIKGIKNARWVVSYDAEEEIKKLYRGFTKIEYPLLHTAHIAKIGQEVLFFSGNIFVPEIANPTKID